MVKERPFSAFPIARAVVGVGVTKKTDCELEGDKFDATGLKYMLDAKFD